MEETTQLKPEEQSDTLLLIKLAFILVIFIEGVLFGIIPQKWRKCRKNEKILSIANAFSGGVFLAIAFVHIIPETAELYYEYSFDSNKLQLGSAFFVKQQAMIGNIKEMILASNATYESEIYRLALLYIEESYSKFPLPFVLVLGGYAFILLIDKVILSGGGGAAGVHDHSKGREDKKNNPFIETEKIQSPLTSTVRTGVYQTQQILNIQGNDDDMYMEVQHQNIRANRQTVTQSSDADSQSETHHDNEDQLRQQFKNLVSRTDKFSNQFFQQIHKKPSQNDLNRLSRNKKLFASYEVQRQSITNQKLRKASFMQPSTSINNPFFENGYSEKDDSIQFDNSKDNLNNSDFKTVDINPNSFLESNQSNKDKKKCSDFGCGCGYLQSIILLVALSTHSIFEGIALGLTSEISSTINIMVGLLCHKGPAAMSLGISLSKKFKKPEDRNKAILLAIFFALTTPIGIAIGLGISNTNNLVEITFNSFAGGTFIYIAASEVIVEEFSFASNKFLKMLFFTLGASMITCMWLLEV